MFFGVFLTIKFLASMKFAHYIYDFHFSDYYHLSLLGVVRDRITEQRLTRNLEYIFDSNSIILKLDAHLPPFLVAAHSK